jgi:hypothetical protein
MLDLGHLRLGRRAFCSPLNCASQWDCCALAARPNRESRQDRATRPRASSRRRLVGAVVGRGGVRRVRPISSVSQNEDRPARSSISLRERGLPLYHPLSHLPRLLRRRPLRPLPPGRLARRDRPAPPDFEARPALPLGERQRRRDGGRRLSFVAFVAPRRDSRRATSVAFVAFVAGYARICGRAAGARGPRGIVPTPAPAGHSCTIYVVSSRSSGSRR